MPTKQDDVIIVFDAIAKETFRPSDVMSDYSVDQLAEYIKEILTSRIVSEDSSNIKVQISEQELENILALTRAILNKRAIEKESLGTKVETKRSPLFAPTFLNSIYKLQAA